MKSWGFIVPCASVLLVMPGCGGSSGSCPGSFQSCTFGSLSDAQIGEFCDAALATPGVTPGKETTCEDGTTVKITGKDACVEDSKANQVCEEAAALESKEMLDCVKASLKDPCNLLESEACAAVRKALAKCQ